MAIRRIMWTVGCLALVIGAFTVAAPSASAQTGPPCDPYPGGCGSTTTEAPIEPSCGISLEAGQIGLEVEVVVHNVPLGEAVRILVGGTEVARATNDGVRSIVAMPAQASGDVVTTFEIPDLDPGSYTVTAVGVGFTVTCGGGGFDILSAASGSGGNGGGDKGALAFTGAQIFGLVLLALVLLAVGYVLVRRSRTRRLA